MRVFRRTLWDERASFVAWALVLATFVLFVASSYQAFGRSEAISQLMNGLPPYMQAMFGGLDWGTPAGYVNTELFSWLPLLIAFYTGLYAASALAREIDSHTAESLLAQPVRRWSVVLGKLGTMATTTLLLHVVVYAALLALLPLFINEPTPTKAFLAATAASYATSLAVGSLALFISAAVNEQRKATVYTSGIILLLYFVNVVGRLSTRMKFLSDVNPFGRYNSAEIVRSGAIAGADLTFLVGFALVFLAATLWWFERKDIA